MKKLLISAMILTCSITSASSLTANATTLKEGNINESNIEIANENIEMQELEVGKPIIDNNGSKHELSLIKEVTENGRQIRNFRLKVTGNHGYFSEVDYTVATYNSGERALTVNWYNVQATPFYVPVKTGIALHKYSGSTYKFDIWRTPTNPKPGVQKVDKRFVVERNWTMQVEARTVYTVGNPGLPGTTYVPKVSVSNH